MTHLASLAQLNNGLVVAIEQRFYGKSAPMPDLSASSLQYMTVENTLKDFAQFIRAVKSNPSSVFPVTVDPDSSVIFAGSSYSANVAAWMRATYPELVAGAWASSAFVYHRLDNYHFEQSFGRQLHHLGCGSQFAQGVQELDSILLSDDASRIESALELFGLPPLSADGFASLVSMLSISLADTQVTVSGNPVHAAICAHFNSNTPALVSYANVIKAAIERFGYSPEEIAAMSSHSTSDAKTHLNQPYRVNYYLSCTWFGNWMTAAPKSTGLASYISRRLNLDYWLSQCQKKFGSSIGSVADIDAFNKKWLGPLQEATNIYYTVGGIDIWRESTVAPASGSNIKLGSNTQVEVIDGAGPSQDYDMAEAADISSVKQARHVGNQLVNKWLAGKSRRIYSQQE
ncbi:hypothetical protein GGI04_001788 [Coemansia thaxteri]|nr:hypothetical protein GGI04_001788 [Coemansia thaxteri]